MSILQSIEHALTTSDLASLNRKLDEVLLNDPVNDNLLQKIIDERANLVESLLGTMDKHSRRRFAANELISNDFIMTTVQAQLSQTKIELGKVSKASKAIKKYQQV
jgi:hypothetical protein